MRSPLTAPRFGAGGVPAGCQASGARKAVLTATNSPSARHVSPCLKPSHAPVSGGMPSPEVLIGRRLSMSPTAPDQPPAADDDCHDDAAPVVPLCRPRSMACGVAPEDDSTPVVWRRSPHRFASLLLVSDIPPVMPREATAGVGVGHRVLSSTPSRLTGCGSPCCSTPVSGEARA